MFADRHAVPLARRGRFAWPGRYPEGPPAWKVIGVCLGQLGLGESLRQRARDLERAAGQSVVVEIGMVSGMANCYCSHVSEADC